MKNLLKKFTIIFSITLIIFNAITLTTFANINEKNLYSKGDCGRLLKKGDIVVKTYVVVYNDNGKEYPAYCLDKEKEGVSDNLTYSVNLDGIIKNVHIWKAITNGYPYKSPQEMGCNTIEEAFMATKMAVYSVLYNYSINDFSPIGEAGQRTWNALNNILIKVNDGNDSQISSNLKIEEEFYDWKENDKDSKYISKDFVVTSEAPMDSYKIIKEGGPEGVKITDLNDEEKEEFANKEKFRVTIPISELSSGGNIKLKAIANVDTKPIFIGRASNSNNQDYAITGISYEEGNGEKEIYFGSNQTKIKIVKKDETGTKNLEGAVFQLLNENKEIIISELKTNKDGEITIENILPGKYYIKEIQSPAGYILYDEYIEINPKFNEELMITIKNSKEDIPEINSIRNKLSINNELKKLPKTGM